MKEIRLVRFSGYGITVGFRGQQNILCFICNVSNLKDMKSCKQFVGTTLCFLFDTRGNHG
jgi:hypothetical protein